MKNGRKLIESQEPDYGALAGITADDWAVMISGGDLTEAAKGQQLARQARTIRRLRALADGYRIRRRVLLDTYGAMAQHLKDCIEYANRDVCKKERARIVAALRENGGLGDMPNFTLRLDYACNVIADAIERGEL